MTQRTPARSQLEQHLNATGKHLPFLGLDHVGMPVNLAAAEDVALRRLTPQGAPRAVAEFDARVADLERRQTSITADLADLHARRAAAPAADSERLAAWQLNAQKGPRPEPQANAIDAEITQHQADLDGLTRAVEKVLADKASYVSKHRPRLMREADRAVTEAHTRLAALIDELAQTRTQLAEARQVATWAALYPDPAAGQTAQPELLAGGLRKPIQNTLGLTNQVPASAIIKALHADADWLKDAATAAQRAVLDPNHARDRAVWTDSDEGRQKAREDRQAAIDSYTREWGRPPSW